MLPACIGLYGILSYVLARRTTKIGIRLALGTVSRQAVTLVLGESAVMTILGLAVGITASFGFSQFVRFGTREN